VTFTCIFQLMKRDGIEYNETKDLFNLRGFSSENAQNYSIYCIPFLFIFAFIQLSIKYIKEQ
jgi:hypothetical protein